MDVELEEECDGSWIGLEALRVMRLGVCGVLTWVTLGWNDV